jgi:hypothetical protein
MFEKIAAVIEESPDRYDQQYFGRSEFSDLGYLKDFEPECRTAHCVAGWALILSGDYKFIGYDAFMHVGGEVITGGAVQHDAAEILGISSKEADHLFAADWMKGHRDGVPEELRTFAAGGNILFYTEPWEDEHGVPIEVIEVDE